MTADHDPFDELAVGWALHALEPEDESFFAAHLSGCARCAATVAETSEVMAAMATDLPQPEPSEGLRHRIRAAVEQTEQVPPRAAEPATPAARPSPRRPRAAAHRRSSPRAGGGPCPACSVAAGLAAIVGLGLWNVVLTNDRQDLQTTVAEQSAFMDQLLSDGQTMVAPLSHDGEMVAMVVARDDSDRGRPGGACRPTTRSPRPTCSGGWVRAGPTRSARSTSSGHR